MRIRSLQISALAVIILASGLAQTPARTRSVAITLDDGPVVNEMKDLENFQRIAGRLREALVTEKVPATIFINERQLNVPGQRDGRAEVLTQWLDAGFEHFSIAAPGRLPPRSSVCARRRLAPACSSR